jgi:outer membrane protein
MADDLLDIYQLARQNDPAYQSAAASFRADSEQLNQARAALLPSLSASASQSRNRDETRATGVDFISVGDASYDSERLSVELSQTLFDMSSFGRLRQGRLTADRAKLDLASAQQDLMLRTASVYLGVLSALDNLQLANAEKTAIARQLELAQARLEVGLGTITDQHDAQARFKLAEARVLEATSELEDSKQALTELIGQPARPLAPLDPGIELQLPEPLDAAAWVDLALAQNPSLQARQRDTEIQQQEVKVQRSGHLPSLKLVGSYSESETDGSISGPGVERENTSASLQLSVPLIEGGLVVSRTAEARYRLDAARQDYEQARRALTRQTRAAYLNVTSLVSKVAALEQAVTASQSALEGKTEGFEAGIYSNIDVLNAQRDLFLAQRDLYQARYDYLLSYLQLQQRAGALDEQTLARANQWLK